MDIPPRAISREDIAALLRDKYEDRKDVDITEDTLRLASGEPLAYVIGWIPFHGLRIQLDSKPLIPRPETEHWTEALIAHLAVRFGETPFRFLDLCAGSGAIGLSILARFPHAHVTFAELEGAHARLIRDNIERNQLDGHRATVCEGDLFAELEGQQFDVIATNPPYIPKGRELEETVTAFEPSVALFAGTDGLGLIRRIAAEASAHLTPGGELWLEADIANIEETKGLLLSSGATHAVIQSDQYGRERYVVAYW